MILLCDLKEDMRPDRSADKSVHVSTCTSHDLNASCMEVVVLIRHVFLRLVG